MSMNVLFCTLGASWAVVPEIYGFLAPDRLPLYENHPKRDTLAQTREEWKLEAPDEIWIATTDGRAVQKTAALLVQWQQLLAPQLLARAPIVRIWMAKDTDQLALPEECQHIQELLLRVCLLAHETADGGQVVLSLAGGRKTMSADMQWASQTLGCNALLHVIGQEPLNADLRDIQPKSMTQPLPARLCPYLLPLVTGKGHRSEVLDLADEGHEAIRPDRFSVPECAPNGTQVWPRPTNGWLRDELRHREEESSQLLANYLDVLVREEQHENWRSLYRLPPRVIDALRKTCVSSDLLDWIVGLPKADLHRHLGGCLDIAGQREVARVIWDNLALEERRAATEEARPLLERKQWPDDWPEWLKGQRYRSHVTAALLIEADDEQLNFNLYDVTEPRVALKNSRLGFSAYERPGDLSGSALLSHPASIEPYARLVAEQARKEGLVYVELRGSPQKYGNDSLRFLQDLENALERTMAGWSREKRIIFRFIQVIDRRQEDRVAEVVRMAVAARQQMPDFLCGLDVAGDERVGAPDKIAQCFLPAFKECLPVTIHAGEGEPADAIWEAAYLLNADRIGHGLTIANIPELANRFRDRGICLELCPTSNQEVVGFHDPGVRDTDGRKQYPMLDLWRAGLPLTLCTDNPGISRTSLANEYVTASRMVGHELSYWDALTMLKQAFLHAFLPSDAKGKLMKDADTKIRKSVLETF